MRKATGFHSTCLHVEGASSVKIGSSPMPWKGAFRVKLARATARPVLVDVTYDAAAGNYFTENFCYEDLEVLLENELAAA